MVAKSAEAFRTISEAAKELDVPQHVLRHWEEVFGQVRPMRRAGGRRYYRPLDIDLLRGIRVLLYDQRYTTKGVQKIFKSNGAKYVGELGRRAGAGEAIELLPVLDNDDPPELSASPEPSPAGPSNKQPASQETGVLDLGLEALADPEISPALHRVLTKLLARLERTQAALDEVTLALDAINSLRDDKVSFDAQAADSDKDG